MNENIDAQIERKDITAQTQSLPQKFAPESEQEVTTSAPKRARATFRLICASKVKKFALEVAKSNPAPSRAKMFTRVSEDFLIAAEAQMKAWVVNRVNSHPSKGKTLT